MADTTALNPFDLLQKVDSFYQTSWQHLLVYSTIGVAFVGVVVPVLLRLYENRQARIAEQNFRDLLKNLVGEAKLELQGILKADHDAHKAELMNEVRSQENKIQAIAEKFKDDLVKRISRTEGGAFHIQGILLLEQKKYLTALVSLLEAISNFVTAEDELNLNRSISGVEQCLGHLNKNSIDGHLDNVVLRFEAMIETLLTVNKNGRYSDKIRELKKAFKDATERTS